MVSPRSTEQSDLKGFLLWKGLSPYAWVFGAIRIAANNISAPVQENPNQSLVANSMLCGEFDLTIPRYIHTDTQVCVPKKIQGPSSPFHSESPHSRAPNNADIAIERSEEAVNLFLFHSG